MLSHVWLFATIWTVVRQALLSLEFSRQKYWGWVAISYSKWSSQARDWTHISCVARIGSRFFTTAPCHENGTTIWLLKNPIESFSKVDSGKKRNKKRKTFLMRLTKVGREIAHKNNTWNGKEDMLKKQHGLKSYWESYVIIFFNFILFLNFT